MVVVLDDDDQAAYHGLDWPEHWHIRIGKRVGQADLYNRVFEEFPKLGWYGILADDVVPRTDGWDRALIEIAGTDGLAAPSGGHEDTDIVPHFCLGGDLVREMGWLCLPGLDRIFVDTTWNDIARHKGVFREVPEVMLEHMHFSNGKAPMDETYRKHNKARDREIYEAWRDSYI